MPELGFAVGLRLNKDLISVIEGGRGFNNVTEDGEADVVGRGTEERKVRNGCEVRDGSTVCEVLVDGVASVDECDCFSHMFDFY